MQPGCWLCFDTDGVQLYCVLMHGYMPNEVVEMLFLASVDTYAIDGLYTYVSFIHPIGNSLKKQKSCTKV